MVPRSLTERTKNVLVVSATLVVGMVVPRNACKCGLFCCIARRVIVEHADAPAPSIALGSLHE